jgi:hypothetical protein
VTFTLQEEPPETVPVHVLPLAKVEAGDALRDDLDRADRGRRREVISQCQSMAARFWTVLSQGADVDVAEVLIDKASGRIPCHCDEHVAVRV